MLRSSHDACGCATQTTSPINLKRSTLHPHEGQADRPNTPSDSVNPGSNPGPPATYRNTERVEYVFPTIGEIGESVRQHGYRLDGWMILEPPPSVCPIRA